MALARRDAGYDLARVGDAPSRPQDLNALFSARSIHYGEQHATMDDLIGAYFGDLPDVFMDFFHEEQHVHIVNMIRLAWDDLAAMSGKEFPLFLQPDNDTTAAKQRAERVENVCYGYNNAGRKIGGVSMKMLMKLLSWWMVGCADAVAMTLPDYSRQTPYFTFRDPRSHFPPIGWSPWHERPLNDTLFAYQTSLAELEMRYPEAKAELSQAYRKRTYVMSTGWQASGGKIGASGGAYKDEDALVWVGEYYSDGAWYVSTLEDRVVVLAGSESGDRGHPGVCPVVAFSLYTPLGGKGRSMFADQISLQAAMSRMFSQKLDFFDKTLYPLIFHTPLTHQHLRFGPMAANQYDIAQGIQPRVDTIQPANPIDVDETMGMVMGMSRILNRNPETMQGAGEANSAKALNELKSGITSTIQDGFWPAFLEGLPKLYSAAMRMDMNLWGNERKKATGKRGKTPFRTEYTPNVHLQGYEEDIEIEPGLGLGGYQGTLEIMQLVGARLISQDTALEELPNIREPQIEKRRIQNDRMEEMLFADLGAKAQQAQLNPGALAEIRRLIQEEGQDLFDAIAQLEQAGRLYAAPPALPGGEGEAQGSPADALAAIMGGQASLEGGAVPGGESLPSLGRLRGVA